MVFGLLAIEWNYPVDYTENENAFFNGSIQFFKVDIGANVDQSCRDALFQVLMECTEDSFISNLTMKILYDRSFISIIVPIQTISMRQSRVFFSSSNPR